MDVSLVTKPNKLPEDLRISDPKDGILHFIQINQALGVMTSYW